VRVELRVERGILFRLSGVNSTSARAAQARIRSALIACGHRWPGKGITVNISPASKARKSTAYDVPIALAILAAEGKISAHAISQLASAGELGLDGTIRKWNTNPFNPEIEGSQLEDLSKIRSILSPYKNIEKSLGLTHRKTSHLTGLIKYLNNPNKSLIKFKSKKSITFSVEKDGETESSFRNLQGEHTVKRKAVLSAAGGHNIIMMGPPVSGKTELAKCIHALLPDLTEEEQSEIEKIHSNSGYRLRRRERPPWREPHISTGAAGLIGSWSSKSDVGVVPGEWSLAHRGVLFLDEWPEFSRGALEACRVPMETGIVALARAAGNIKLPAKALLIAALNPCPCGRLTDEFNVCICAPSEVRRYLKKLSGPVADRFAIHIELGNERENLKNLTKNSTNHLKRLNYCEKHDKNTKFSKKSLIHDSAQFHNNSSQNLDFLKKPVLYNFRVLLEDNKSVMSENWTLFKDLSNFDEWFLQQISVFNKSSKIIKNDESITNYDKLSLINDIKALFSENNQKLQWRSLCTKVKEARQWRSENFKNLDLSRESEHWFQSFSSISRISERGKMHVLKVAETAALVDGMELIEFNHIVEAAEGRLFDRMSWLSGANDDRIPKFDKCNKNP
jgi:magnesium chelatase family protein